MNYLHIMPPSNRYMRGYITMLRENFDSSKHTILFTDQLVGNDISLMAFENVINFPQVGKNRYQKFRRLNQIFMEHDRIIFHSFDPNNKWLLFIYMHIKYLKKSTWIIWGKDLYNYKLPNTSLKNRVTNRWKEKCHKAFLEKIILSSGEKNIYRSIMGEECDFCIPYGFLEEHFVQMDEINAKNHAAYEMAIRAEQNLQISDKYIKFKQAFEVDKLKRFLSAKTKEDLENAEINVDKIEMIIKSIDSKKISLQSAVENGLIDLSEYSYDSDKEYCCENQKTNNRVVNIQIGHNAYPFENHCEVLTYLSRFKTHRIKFYIPLSYGDTNIDGKNHSANIVTRFTNILFPDKNVQKAFITKLRTPAEYTKILADVDIAIFNARRQSGIGNIERLLYMGKKVYLSKQSPLYQYYLDKGFEIHSVEELRTCTFEELIQPVHVSYPNPWIHAHTNFNIIADKWKNVFDYHEGKISHEDALKNIERMDADIELLAATESENSYTW